MLRAGVEIKLQPGWKTYWRYPGDSGVPPVFDFAASDNVKSATVLWPAPVRFADGGGNSIGYKGDVIFPLRIVPRDAGQAGHAAAQARLCGVRDALRSGQGARLNLCCRARRARRRPRSRLPRRACPKPAAWGDGPALMLRKAWRDAAAGKPRVLVDVAAPAGAEVDLFAEGPAPDWALPLPEPVAGAAAGAQRFAFELDGLPTGAKPRRARPSSSPRRPDGRRSRPYFVSTNSPAAR